MIKEELMNRIAYRQKVEIGEADELVNEGLNEAIDAVLEFWEENKVTVSKEEEKWLDKLTDIYDLKTATYYITRCGYGHGFEFTFQDKTYRLEDNDEQNYLEISEMKERFLKALFYGYEVEKVKLYTVELPNPYEYDNAHITLSKKSGDKVYIDYHFNDCWQTYEKSQLTEAEIKKDFDWAWQFAKEVKGE